VEKQGRTTLSHPRPLPPKRQHVLFRDQGIELHAVSPDVSAKRNGEALEIDLLVVNDGALIGVECKSTLIEEHIDRHLTRLEMLKRVLPSYKNHRAIGAVAGIVVADPACRIRHGARTVRPAPKR
jgi:hypothetical protein